jgi:hypothetical protein
MDDRTTLLKVQFENGHVLSWYAHDGDLFSSEEAAHRRARMKLAYAGVAAEAGAEYPIEPGMTYDLIPVEYPLFHATTPHVLVDEGHGYAQWLWNPEATTLSEAKEVFDHYVAGMTGLGRGRDLPGAVMPLRQIGDGSGFFVDVWGRPYIWPVAEVASCRDRGLQGWASLHDKDDSRMWVPE